jgi:hypothetical protein
VAGDCRNHDLACSTSDEPNDPARNRNQAPVIGDKLQHVRHIVIVAEKRIRIHARERDGGLGPLEDARPAQPGNRPTNMLPAHTADQGMNFLDPVLGLHALFEATAPRHGFKACKPYPEVNQPKIAAPISRPGHQKGGSRDKAESTGRLSRTSHR